MSRLAYFAADGNYGDADGIVIVDTTYWSAFMWEQLDNCSDLERVRLASYYASEDADSE